MIMIMIMIIIFVSETGNNCNHCKHFPFLLVIWKPWGKLHSMVKTTLLCQWPQGRWMDVLNRHGKRCGHVDIVWGNFWALRKFFYCRRLFTLIIERYLMNKKNFFIYIRYLAYIKDDFHISSSYLWKFQNIYLWKFQDIHLWKFRLLTKHI